MIQKKPSLEHSTDHLFYCDAHVDTLSKMLKFGWKDLKEIPRPQHITLQKLRQSPAGVLVFACFTEKHEALLSPTLSTLKMIDLAYATAAKHVDLIEIIGDYAGFKRSRKNNKLAIILSMENGIAVERDIALLRIFHRLGVRLMSLTWNHRNLLGDGVGHSKSRRGLTSLGREVLAEMERIGMIIDLSHLSERTFWDVIEATSGPIVATHSNAFSICPHPRNLTDAQIQAIASRHGFIGLNFCSLFLTQSGQASSKDIIKHAEHIAAVGGDEVLAIGSDYDGISDPPSGLEHIGKMGALFRDFKKSGFSENQINKLAHDNFLRVFKAVCG